MSYQSIGIIGGGAWGTSLAQSAHRASRDALLWAYEPETITDINEAHQNRTYLPGVTLDRAIRATGKLTEIADCDAVLMVAPAQHVRGIAAELAESLPEGRPVVICAKGIEQKTHALMSEVMADALPQATAAVLSGPSFAAEVARGLPAAVTLACADEETGKALVHALGHTTFRPYWSSDLIGAQIGGAVKNVLAIAAGIVAGKELGASAHAALTTRGFAEIVRLGSALGARPETLSGLSGLGDLLLTCGSPQSRNMSLGKALGEGRTMKEVLGARKSISEGVFTASAVAEMARDHGLDMPICQAVHEVVSGDVSVDDAIEGLLSRPFRAEN
ncbi:MAG: NAD(P)H-dependent glycerol-3-phosphate dehydrogenase [Methyloligellaceae bacterium]